MANQLALEIERILAQELGEFIATATVNKNSEAVGCTPDTITADKLPALADKINKSVSFFSGKETGARLASKIKSLEV